MARFYPNGAGAGGVTSEEVTVSSYDVPKSKTALTSDSDDGVIYGKLEEYSSAVEAANSKDEVNKRILLTIPNRGLYTSSAKLFATYENIRALIGLSEGNLANGQKVLGITGGYKGLGDATPADVRTGKKFSTAGLSNADGTMPEQGGSTVIPGVSNKTAVEANRYVNGNVIVSGDPNLVAENIKKGSTIFGVKGSWEGFVPSPSHIYKRGQWADGWGIDNFKAKCICSVGSFQDKSKLVENSDSIRVEMLSKDPNTGVQGNYINTSGWFSTISNNILNVSGYSKLNLIITEAKLWHIGPQTNTTLTIIVRSDSGSTVSQFNYYTPSYGGSNGWCQWDLGASEMKVTVDISKYNGFAGFEIKLYEHIQSWGSHIVLQNDGETAYIKEIWFE